jgi:hypothetical protein
LILTAAILSVGIFVAALSMSGVAGAASGVLATTQATMAVMRDATLDDAARERAVQRSSLKLVSDFVSILLRGGLSLAASLLPIWLMDAAGLVSARSVLGFLSRVDVMVGTTIVMVLGYVAWTRVWRSN